MEANQMSKNLVLQLKVAIDLRELRTIKNQSRDTTMLPDSDCQEPSGCRWCGIGKRLHFNRWTESVGRHRYEPPTQEQILTRMKARRLDQPKGSDDYP
jgi:hypothetical protein